MAAWFFAAILLAAAGDGWNNLKRVTRDRLYAVILRDGRCKYGTLSSVGEQTIILDTDSGLGVLIKRSQIARVSDNLIAPGLEAVFSARSSWLDVKTTAPKGTEYLHIVSKGGDEWKWKRPVISDGSISFEGITIGKADVRYVFYVRSKPLTIYEEYLHEPGFKWLASIPWVGNLMADKISVLLYDSDLAEDNSPMACR
jgi:hypothetical protein